MYTRTTVGKLLETIAATLKHVGEGGLVTIHCAMPIAEEISRKYPDLWSLGYHHDDPTQDAVERIAGMLVGCLVYGDIRRGLLFDSVTVIGYNLKTIQGKLDGWHHKTQLNRDVEKNPKVVEAVEPLEAGVVFKLPKKLWQIHHNILREDAIRIKTGDEDYNDLGVDSLDRVEMIMAVEDCFSISIPDEDTDRLRTPNEVVRYLKSRDVNLVDFEGNKYVI